LDTRLLLSITKVSVSWQHKSVDFQEVTTRKGHNYLTLVFDLKKGKLIWIGEDRTKQTLDQFFKRLGKEGWKEILAIAMDMWTPYEGSLKEDCPQAKIVYDKFHITSAYSKVIDKVRRQEFHKASEQEKEIIKRTKYLLLKNRENLKKDEPQRLNQLLKLLTETFK
jgi:transposase